MPMTTEKWKNTMELDDGRLLEVCYVLRQQRGGYADPAEREEETHFRIGGVPVFRDELPAEVTTAVIKKLVDDAVRSTNTSD